MNDALEPLFAAIRANLAATRNSCHKESLFARLRNLAGSDEPVDYPEAPTPVFPTRITIAYSVCSRSCGSSAFLVDGGPQTRDFCGGLMFRSHQAEYALAPETPSEPAPHLSSAT